jgi:hypothetical protein
VNYSLGHTKGQREGQSIAHCTYVWLLFVVYKERMKVFRVEEASRHSVLALANLKLQKVNAQKLFFNVNGFLLLLIVYTSYKFPSRYIRVNGTCSSNWLHEDSLEEKHEIICCGTTQKDLPCYPGMDILPILASAEGSYALPFTGLIFNYMMVILGPNATLPRIRVLIRRALLYGALLAYRTLFLYIGLGQLEHQIVRLFGNQDKETCWYASLRRHGKCLPHFDYSDHLVLLMSHFIAIPLFEWFALDVEIPQAWRFSLKKTFLRLWLFFIGSFACYLIFFTSAFFHAPLENLVAFGVAQLFVMLPLYLLTQDAFRGISKYFSLELFVLPTISKDSK